MRVLQKLHGQMDLRDKWGQAFGLPVKMPVKRLYTILECLHLISNPGSSLHLPANADLGNSNDGSGHCVSAAHMGDLGCVLVLSS